MDVEAQQSWNCQRAEDYSLAADSSQAAHPGGERRTRYPAPMPPKLIVIDSQSLFDWMVFRNPACARWNAALSGTDWEWIFTSEMRAEFDFVAAKGFGERWPVDAAAVASIWARHARLVDDAAAAGRRGPAALHGRGRPEVHRPGDRRGAHTLVTRDKALLRLARKALERHGVRICGPQAWSAELG